MAGNIYIFTNLNTDKREIEGAANSGERRIHTSPSDPPPPTRAISQ